MADKDPKLIGHLLDELIINSYEIQKRLIQLLNITKHKNKWCFYLVR